MAIEQTKQHAYDIDCTCVVCGFDGAEFHWWKHHTYEGKASPDIKEPECKLHDVSINHNQSSINDDESNYDCDYAADYGYDDNEEQS